jgi:molybdopterin synthase sulfur carrier subunit
MPVTFRIPNYLASFAGNSSVVKLDGSSATVHDALETLWRLHPGLRDRIVDEQGAVRQHVNIFVGDNAIRFGDGLATPVPTDVEILIVPAVSGG